MKLQASGSIHSILIGQFFPELLSLVDYLCCNQTFPSSFTKQGDRLEALKDLLIKHSKAKFAIATLGGKGSLLMQVDQANSIHQQKTVNSWTEFEQVIQRNDGVSLEVVTFVSAEIGMPHFRVTYCPALPIKQVVDTTGWLLFASFKGSEILPIKVQETASLGQCALP